MSGLVLPRRRLIARAGGLALSLPLLSACDAINDAPPVRKILSLGAKMHLASQRALTDRDPLARAFGRAEHSPASRHHRTRPPPGHASDRHSAVRGKSGSEQGELGGH